MCGIMGYIGHGEASGCITDGLSKLEYRGYDSAGIAVINKRGIEVRKSKGELKNLLEKLDRRPVTGSIGIGHTRWSTHGAPSDINSHPHLSKDKTFAVVHNGIIENYLEIKALLTEKGYRFISDTDTECIAHLLHYNYDSEHFLETVRKTLDMLEGAYALGIICKDFPDTIIAAKKDSPLIIGLGKDENYIASDIPAILERTRDVYILDEYELAVVKADSVEIYDINGDPVNKNVFKVEWSLDAAEKGGFEHFMLKEIYEQPRIVKDLALSKLPPAEHRVNLEGISLDKSDLEKINRIYVVACGTAYHAGLLGKYFIEKIARIPVVAEVASEFIYKDPILDESTLVIAVSQSGETADTKEAVKIAKSHNAKVLAVVNAIGSSIAREANEVFYILAGPEIAVASTKAFSAQVTAMYLITCHIAMQMGKMSVLEFEEIKASLYALPDDIEDVLEKAEEIRAVADKYYKAKNVFFIGRGADYLVSMEGSLKLKEIAYINSEAYAAGELKHGPIAMIEEESLVVAIATQQELFRNTLSNIKEVKARSAKVFGIAVDGNKDMAQECDDVVYIPVTHPMVSPLLANIVSQIFAYYMAYNLGTNIDKPRNLAKSVTVQ